MTDQRVEDVPLPLCFSPPPPNTSPDTWESPNFRAHRIKKTSPSPKIMAGDRVLRNTPQGFYIDSEGRQRRIVFVLSEREMGEQPPKLKVSEVIRELADRFKRALFSSTDSQPVIKDEPQSPLPHTGCPASLATLDTTLPSESEPIRSDITLAQKEAL